jgi:hypothetical protein
MFPSIWSRLAQGKQPASRSRRHSRRGRLHVEPLEDRCLLSTYTPGPLVLLSSPDPLAACPPGGLGADVATEPYVAVNPANPKNIVAAWIDHGAAGIGAGASFDGGKTWQNVAIPGITQCTGGTEPLGFDPWLTFAPNGDLYSISIGVGLDKDSPFLVNKSTDGGLTWGSPIRVDTVSPSGTEDKGAITADPTKPNYVYATWARFTYQFHNANNAATMFARSTDGGRTWEPARDIHDASDSDFDWGHQIVVLPDGTLIDAFTEGQFKNNHQAALTLLRSTDHGQTWSAPIQAVVQQPLVDPKAAPPNALVTDPDTGHAVEAHPMFDSVAVDRSNGNLYAAWIDARFSNFQYNSIAFSMSSDGGLTWSQPIQVNQTPNTGPPIDRQAWNPTVAVAADGTVAVTYYDFRNNTPDPGALTDYWLAYCRPSARAPATNPANWSEVRLTNTSFDLEQAPTRFDGDFLLGDYEGLATAGNDFVAVWGMPNGTSAGQESIFFRRVIAGAPLQAAAVGHNPVTATLTSQQADALLPEAIHRWHAVGVDTSALRGIDVRIADLGGATLGLASGHTIWLDANAAGWGWFVDKTPWEDSEFTTPGNQGEQNRLDLLTALEHEIGHLLGHEHGHGGVMAEALLPGTRPRFRRGADSDTSRPVGDVIFAPIATNLEAPWPGSILVGSRRRR